MHHLRENNYEMDCWSVKNKCCLDPESTSDETANVRRKIAAFQKFGIKFPCLCASAFFARHITRLGQINRNITHPFHCILSSSLFSEKELGRHSYNGSATHQDDGGSHSRRTVFSQSLQGVFLRNKHHHVQQQSTPASHQKVHEPKPRSTPQHWPNPVLFIPRKCQSTPVQDRRSKQPYRSTCPKVPSRQIQTFDIATHRTWTAWSRALYDFESVVKLDQSPSSGTSFGFGLDREEDD